MAQGISGQEILDLQIGARKLGKFTDEPTTGFIEASYSTLLPRDGSNVAWQPLYNMVILDAYVIVDGTPNNENVTVKRVESDGSTVLATITTIGLGVTLNALARATSIRISPVLALSQGQMVQFSSGPAGMDATVVIKYAQL